MRSIRLLSIYWVTIAALALFGCSSDISRKLLTAAGDGDVAQVKALIQEGADVNYELFDTNTTPLMAAARKGHLEVAKILLAAGAKINTVDDGVGTALYWAAFEGELEMVKFLLSQKGMLNCSSDSATYLLQTVRSRGFHEVEELVEAQLRIEKS